MLVKIKVFFCILLVLGLISGCSSITNSSESTGDCTQSSQPQDNLFPEAAADEVNTEQISAYVNGNTLNESEYWDVVQAEINDLLAQYNLYVFQTGTEIPYINYYVEYGYSGDDGKYVPVGLTEEECSTLKDTIQAEMLAILSQYQLEKGSSLWSRPARTTIGVFIHNRFANSTFNPIQVERHCVSGYQIDVIDFYYEKEDNNFVKMDYFDSDLWNKFDIYTP